MGKLTAGDKVENAHKERATEQEQHRKRGGDG